MAAHNMLLLYGGQDRPVIDWSFLGAVPSTLTYTNASGNRSYFDAYGVMRFAGINEPRFDHNPVTHEPLGLLMEGQRTNSLTRSFLLSGWTNNSAISTTDNVYTSPDGTQNATQIVSDAQFRGRYINVSSLSTSTAYSVSGFVKSFAGSDVIRVGAQNAEGGATNAYLHINTTTGAVVANGAAAYDIYSVLLPNGWTYFRYRFVTGAAQTVTPVLAYSIGSGSTFCVWGTQVEVSSVASSCIQTVGTAVTRATDALSFLIPSGVTTLRYIFDDNSTQDVAVTAGAYSIPTDLNRPHIKRIISV